jgi:hypothetical protein
MYQGFQELKNCHLAGGVEPLGIAALLAPADGAKDEPEPIVAALPAAFFTIAASFAAFFIAIASFTDFFTTAASATSFSIAALVAVAMSSAVELPLDPPGAVAHATTDEPGRGAVVAWGGGTVDLPLRGALIHLYSGTSSLDDTSLSLWMTHTTFPFPLLGAGVDATPPWPPVVPVPGICTPRDWSPLWINAMPMSSIEGIATSSNVLAAWSLECGWHDAGGVTKSWEDGSGLNFSITSVSTSSPSVDPSLLSSCVMSFTLV